MKKYYYIIMVMNEWSKLKTKENNIRVKFGKSYGQYYSCIFDSKEEAEKYHPNAEILTVEIKLKNEKS